jgi:NB-ARC domain
LPAGTASNPEQLAMTVRAVLDELIDALRSSGSSDLNSPSVRRFIIADYLYRRGLKQTEICPSRLPLSKSQFYRERTETLLTLANYIQRWEQRTVEWRKRAAIRSLAMLAPAGDSQLIGVDSLLVQVTKALTAAEGPKLIMLCGLGGLGKTAVAQAAAEQVLHGDHFQALGWLSCQRQRFAGSHLQLFDAPELTADDFYNQLLCQLRPNAISDCNLFALISEQVQDDKVTFNQVLDFLHYELDKQEPSHLPLSEKRSLVMDMLWAVPTLIVVDGLESVPDAPALIEELWQISSRTSAKVLITSRRRFSEYAYVKPIDVGPLPDGEAIRLLQRYAAELGSGALDSAPLEDLRTVVNTAGGNPLVIKWIVNQLAALPVRQILAELSQVTGLGSELYDYIYRQAWDSLSESAQELLITIARSPLTSLTWEALRCDTGLRPEVLNRSLQELVAASLIPVSTGLEPSYRVGATTGNFVLAESREAESNHRDYDSLLLSKFSTAQRWTSSVESLMIVPNVPGTKRMGKRSHDRSDR